MTTSSLVVRENSPFPTRWKFCGRINPNPCTSMTNPYAVGFSKGLESADDRISSAVAKRLVQHTPVGFDPGVRRKRQIDDSEAQVGLDTLPPKDSREREGPEEAITRLGTLSEGAPQ